MTKLVFGSGYLGLRVARLWRDAGDPVFAVTRCTSRAREFEAVGLRPIVADVTDARSLQGLPKAESVLYSIGSDRARGTSMRDVYVQGLRNVLAALPEETGRILYIGSTGVYAQSGGEWVDEDSACRPMRESGRICLEAEDMLRGHRLGLRTIILRLAGIYGPGRIPRQEAIVAGQPIAAPSTGWMNLIHVEDAARIVLAAEQQARPPRLYTVSDARPPQRREYYEELARLLGAPQPKFVEPAPDLPAAMRAESNKRVRNARMLAELNVKLQYPSYREGLAAIVAAEAALAPPGGGG
jgi:nucleoside-diphosphate-sugar epimerase